MIYIDFDRDSSEPLYIQAFNQLAKKINHNEIKGGTRLPSSRQMSKQMNVSVNTITNAYNLLVQYGYISSEERSGYYVNDITKTDENVPERKWHSDAPYTYNFSRNGSDLSVPASLKKSYKYCLKNFIEDAFSYPDYTGTYDLRKQISLMLNKTLDINCSPLQVIVGSGLETLLDSLFRIMGNDMVFGLENPAYYRIASYMRLGGRRLSYLNIETDGPTQKSLNNFNADILFLMPFHHYPMYYTMSKEQKRMILDWAGKDRYIIEYGYVMDFVYKNQSKPLFSMSQNKNVIFAGDFQRSIAPNISTAYLILPEHLVNLWQKEYYTYHSYVSKAEQEFIAEIIKNGSYYTNLKRLRKQYQNKQEHLVSCLCKHPLGQKIEIKNTDAGTTILMVPKPDISEENLIVSAHKKGVKLSYIKNALEQENPKVPLKTFILGFGELSIPEIEAGAKLLMDTWTPLLNGSL